MRIYTRVVCDIATGEVLAADSFEYNGPIALCRGENEKAWNRAQISKSQAGLQAAGGYGAGASSEIGYLDPALRGIAATPMSAAEKAGTLSAAGGAFDALSQKAGERVAKTRNVAGYGELLDELARGRSRSMAETAAGLGSEEFRRKMAALKDIQGLYGTQVGAQTNLLRPEQPVKEPHFWDDLIMQLVQSGGQVGAAALGG